MERGQPWGEPAGRPADLTVTGSDAVLARAVAGRAGILVRWEGVGDLGRSLGLSTAAAGGELALPLDVLVLDDGQVAVNAVVWGVAPDRLRWWHRSPCVRVAVDGQTCFDGHAAGIVVANGQFLRGADVAPRAHPGDAHCDVAVYALRAGERASMRRRLPQGAHVPHPRILTRTGRQVSLTADRALALEVDGEVQGARRGVVIGLEASAYCLLV